MKAGFGGAQVTVVRFLRRESRMTEKSLAAVALSVVLRNYPRSQSCRRRIASFRCIYARFGRYSDRQVVMAQIGLERRGSRLRNGIAVAKKYTWRELALQELGGRCPDAATESDDGSGLRILRGRCLAFHECICVHRRVF